MLWLSWLVAGWWLAGGVQKRFLKALCSKINSSCYLWILELWLGWLVVGWPSAKAILGGAGLC